MDEAWLIPFDANNLGGLVLLPSLSQAKVNKTKAQRNFLGREALPLFTAAPGPPGGAGGPTPAPALPTSCPTTNRPRRVFLVALSPPIVLNLVDFQALAASCLSAKKGPAFTRPSSLDPG